MHGTLNSNWCLFHVLLMSLMFLVKKVLSVTKCTKCLSGKKTPAKSGSGEPCPYLSFSPTTIFAALPKNRSINLPVNE